MHRLKIFVLAFVMSLVLSSCKEESTMEVSVKKMLVPLYSYPSSNDSWERLIALKNNTNNLEIVAIVNQSNGDFTQPSTSYINGIESLHNAGIDIVGYVYTQYSQRPIDEVKQNIDAWVEFYKPYGLKGFFFDEASNDEKDFEYYKNITQYAQSKGMKFNILNPGTSVDSVYMEGDIASVVVIRETTYTKVVETTNLHQPTEYTKKALLLYSSDQENMVQKVCSYALEHNFEYVYATDHGITDDRWDSLSSYVNELAVLISKGCKN
ncbi:spherulation-specific family 4 protein [Sulfurimonas microaerophilic]|uniref:spherulation-specific family 4 protein n=1 Tax=Sulfurimonas microaerophilic TaxID=3058392 RepID=UPI0027148D0B|nr:spherulation-specific family 4 protein [Sulfurimonas sp. hsl 1-7]